MYILGETVYPVILKKPVACGTVMRSEFFGKSFCSENDRGWQYLNEYQGPVDVMGDLFHMYKSFLVNKTMTRREQLFERLDYCMHEHWGLVADPDFDYDASVRDLRPGTVDRLLVEAELVHALMHQHGHHQEGLVLAAHNKLVAHVSWAFGAEFWVCSESGILCGQQLN